MGMMPCMEIGDANRVGWGFMHEAAAHYGKSQSVMIKFHALIGHFLTVFYYVSCRILWLDSSNEDLSIHRRTWKVDGLTFLSFDSDFLLDSTFHERDGSKYPIQTTQVNSPHVIKEE